MKAIAARLKAHEQPLDVEEADLAEPGEGEVVVEMAFGGVNPVDRYGALGTVAPDGPLPRILGGEGSATLEGRRVLLRGHGLGAMRDGLWATRAVVPEAAAIDIPDGVSLETAAAMGIAGVTAWRTTTELAKVSPEDRVLVLGASGGVGSMILSIAHHLGATVWGQTGDAEKQEFVAGLGADRVLVSGDEERAIEAFVAELRELRPTVAFDPLGGPFFGAAVQALEPRGRLVPFGTSAGASGTVPLQQIYRKSIRVMGYGGLIESDEDLRAGIEAAMGAVREGRFEVRIDSVIPLAEVNEAFDRLAGRGVQGKLVLDLNL